MNISELYHEKPSIFSIEDFTTSPYRKASEYFDLFVEYACYSNLPVCERILKSVKHLALGIIFAIPLVNIVAMLGYLILINHYEPVLYKNGQSIRNTEEIELTPCELERDAVSPLAVFLKISEDPTLEIEQFSQAAQESFLYLTNIVHSLQQNEKKLFLTKAYEFHLLHTHLTRISKNLGHREIFKTEWFEFLTAMKKVHIQFPNHTIHLLDLTNERFIYDHPTHRYQIETTVPTNLSETEISEMAAIEKSSFSYPLSYRNIRSFNQSEGSKVILAKHKDSIVGSLLYKNGVVTSVARRPDAVMGVGQALFKKLKEELSIAPPEKIKLQVRASNDPAIQLYKQIGFLFEDVILHYYSYPKEDALLMTCQELIC